MLCSIFCGVFFVEAIVNYAVSKHKRAIVAIITFLIYLILAIYMALAIHRNDLGALSPPEMRYEYPSNE